MRPSPWARTRDGPEPSRRLPLTAACEQFTGVPQRDAASTISPPTAEHAWFEPSCATRPKHTFCKADVWSRYSNTKQQVVTKTLIPRISQKTFYKWHENSCTVKKCLIHNFYNVPLHTQHIHSSCQFCCVFGLFKGSGIDGQTIVYLSTLVTWSTKLPDPTAKNLYST